MDEDFEDLLRDPDNPDAEFSSPEKPPAVKLPNISNIQLNIDEKAIPSANELRLGKRLSELEKERDELMAEIASLKTQQISPQHPTIPVSITQPNLSSANNQPIEVPPSLLPVLAVLRTHISELTRDNQALRYTFLGPNPPTRGTIKTSQNPTIPSPLPIPQPASSSSLATSSKVTLDVDMPPATPSIPNPPGPSDAIVQGGTEAESSKKVIPPASGLSQIDLEKILDRVKELIKENEELGEMILESGRKEDLEVRLEKALEDSRNVISSLDSDLNHHLTLVQSLRTELSSYKTHFGPIPSSSSSSSATLNAPSKHPISSNASTPTRPSHSHSHTHTHPPRDRDRREGSHTSHTRRDRDRDDKNRNERHTPGSGLGRGGPDGDRRDRSNGNGPRNIPSGPSGMRNNNGVGVKEDDRAYKRRR
ncbi:hypothetical protein V866_002285 [Kwoniella sp. B9012]